MRIVDIEPMILALEKEKARDDCRGFWYSTVCSIVRLAESLPEIDATERKKGKWINNHSEHRHTFKCSVCGEYLKPKCVIYDSKTHVLLDNSMKWDFCPNCGAEMEQ